MYILATLTAVQSTVRSIYMVQCVLHLLSSLQNRPVLMQNAQSNESNGFRLLLLSLACLGSFGRFVLKTRRMILLITPDLSFSIRGRQFRWRHSGRQRPPGSQTLFPSLCFQPLPTRPLFLYRCSYPWRARGDTANCTIIDHFSTFEPGLVAPFLYAA